MNKNNNKMETSNVIKRIDEEITQSLEREITFYRQGANLDAVEEMGIQNGLSMAKAIIEGEYLLSNNNINNEE